MGMSTLFIVGMGASAGGLDAFEQFFTHMPSESGMAFVLITHLSPTHESIMPELLKKYTKMKVFHIEDGMKVEPNCVYVTPPNKDIAIMDGTLQLMEPAEPRGLRLPIDYFLKALAHDQRERAIAIILSGTGSDGTLGIHEIKAESGMVMVQDLESAKYDAMLKSAISTGLVDYILPADKMSGQLLTYVRQSSLYKKKIKSVDQKGISNAHQKILIFIRSKIGQDFSFYKKNTIYRRIERRMDIHQINSAEDYLSYLQQNQHEVEILFQELLIGVTSFFRDPEAFKLLREKVILRMIIEVPEDHPLRVWVPGCSNGEEAYSLAMIIRECMDELNKDLMVQIFATDINLRAIDKARTGKYPAGISADLSTDRLNRFFIRKENTYRVKKEIREMVIFAPQNVIKDPPFTKLDMISCRNLLIYLESEIQKKLISLFHYALKPNGILFLGSSEGIGEFSDLFSAVDKKWRVFQRRDSSVSTQLIVNFPPMLPWREDKATKGTKGMERSKKGAEGNMSHVIEKMLAENYAPPCAIINEKGDVLYIHGRTGKYLEPSLGKQSDSNILEMTPKNLRIELSSAIHQAISRKREIIYKDLEIKAGVGRRICNITIKPLKEPEAMHGLLLVAFEDMPSQEEAKRDNAGKTSISSGNKNIEEVEKELRYTKEYLQSAIEELETNNEELTSTNEELQSTNEELQSTNEEMETSQEELQSLNEEHVTLNAELQGRIDELSRVNNDLKNLLEGTEIATIFLDRNLCITRFTSRATEIINLLSGDIGRPIHDLAIKLNYEDLIKDAREVLNTFSFKEKEVQTKGDDGAGRWYLMRIKPYRTIENTVDGLVLTFVDIHALHEQKLTIEKYRKLHQEARDYVQAIVDTVRESLVVLDKDLRVISCNRSFYHTFQTRPDETEGRFIYDLGSRQWDIPSLREFLEQIIPQSNVFEDFEVESTFADIGYKKLLLNARRIYSHEKSMEMILLAIEDVTESKRISKPLRSGGEVNEKRSG